MKKLLFLVPVLFLIIIIPKVSAECAWWKPLTYWECFFGEGENQKSPIFDEFKSEYLIFLPEEYVKNCGPTILCSMAFNNSITGEIIRIEGNVNLGETVDVFPELICDDSNNCNVNFFVSDVETKTKDYSNKVKNIRVLEKKKINKTVVTKYTHSQVAKNRTILLPDFYPNGTSKLKYVTHFYNETITTPIYSQVEVKKFVKYVPKELGKIIRNSTYKKYADWIGNYLNETYENWDDLNQSGSESVLYQKYSHLKTNRVMDSDFSDGLWNVSDGAYLGGNQYSASTAIGTISVNDYGSGPVLNISSTETTNGKTLELHYNETYQFLDYSSGMWRLTFDVYKKNNLGSLGIMLTSNRTADYDGAYSTGGDMVMLWVEADKDYFIDSTGTGSAPGRICSLATGPLAGNESHVDIYFNATHINGSVTRGFVTTTICGLTAHGQVNPSGWLKLFSYCRNNERIDGSFRNITISNGTDNNFYSSEILSNWYNTSIVVDKVNATYPCTLANGENCTYYIRTGGNPWEKVINNDMAVEQDVTNGFGWQFKWNATPATALSAPKSAYFTAFITEAPSVDATPPQVQIGTNDSSPKINFHINITVNSSESGYCWIFDNMSRTNTTPVLCNMSYGYTINVTGGSSILFKAYGNDSENNLNNTESITTTITNTDPVVATPIINSTPSNENNTNSTLWGYNGSITDVDYGDTLTKTHSWYNNSILTEFTDQYIGSGNTTEGEVWKYQVNVNDGTATVSTNSTSLTISGLPPLLSLTINATDHPLNKTEANLTWYNTSSSVDSNEIFLDANWFEDDISLTVLNMNFNINETSNGVTDYSGYGNNGNNLGATWNRTGGLNGSPAYEFSAGSAFNISSPVNLDGFSDGTIETWIYLKSLGGDSCNSHNGLSSCRILMFTYDWGFMFGINSDGAIIMDMGSEGTWNTVDNTQAGLIGLNTWYHITVVPHDSNTIDYYVDGILVNSTSVSYTTFRDGTKNELMIGRHFGQTSSRFNGSISSVKIYNRSLSASQIYANYINGINKYPSKTLTSDETTKGKSYKALVIASDTYEETLVNTSEILIQNTAPTLTLTINATDHTNNRTEANLSWYNTSSDGDNDEIFFDGNWFEDNVSFTVLNMNFNINETGSGVKDYSGYGNNGTVINATWNRTGGLNGSPAYDFDGINNYVEINSVINDIQTNTIGTISLWFNVNDITQTGNIFGASDSGDTNSWMTVYYNTNADRFCVGCYENNIVKYNDYAGPVLSEDRWYYVSVVQDGVEVKVFIDGVKYSLDSIISDGTCWFNTIGDIDEVSIGSHVDGGGRSLYFNGSVDNLKIYNRTLSDSQIYQNYQDELNKYPSKTLTSDETTKNKSYKALVIASDTYDDNLVNTSSILIQNSPPFFNTTIPDLEANTGNSLSVPAVNVSDVDGDNITYYTNNSVISIDSNGVINDTYVDESDTGIWSINISVDDGDAGDVSQIITYTVNDTIPPKYYNLMNNASTVTLINGFVNSSVNLTDGVKLSHYKFGTNATGTWITYDPVAIPYQSINVSVVNQTTIAHGYICANFTFNDTNNNWNTTDLSCFTVANTISIPTIIYPLDRINYSLSTILLQVSSSNVDGDTINYLYYINGSLNASLTTNHSFKGEDGSYNFTVGAYDGYDYSDNVSIVFGLDTTPPVITVSFNNTAPKFNDVVNASATANEVVTNWWIWNNMSFQNVTGTEEYNISVVNHTRGSNVSFVFCANDTVNNMGCGESSFVVDNTPSATPTIIYPLDRINYSLSTILLQVSSSDDDGDTIEYLYYINGSLNASLTANYTFAIGHGDFNFYNLTVGAYDGYNYSSNSTSLVFGLYTISSISIYIYDEETSAPIYHNISILFSNDVSEEIYYTNTSTFEDSNILPGEYSVTFNVLNSSLGYSLRTYTLTISNISDQSLDVFLTKDTATTTFTVRDRDSSALLENVLSSMYKMINNTWEPVESRYTDITGKVPFTYRSNVRYKFFLAKSDYENYIFYLNPVLFSSYTIQMIKSVSIETSQDYDRIALIYAPSVFTNDQENNFTFIIQSPSGELVDYGFVLTYPGGGFQNNASNSIGSQLEANFTIMGAADSDRLKLVYFYESILAGRRNYTYYYDIISDTAINTFMTNRDKTYGLGILERILVTVLIVLFVVGIATLTGKPIEGMALGLLVMVYISYIGFTPKWLVLITVTIGVIILGSKPEG